MKKAPHGEKMIRVTLYFWTNNMTKAKGQIVPKHAWTAGTARTETNKSHGIKAKEVHFHTLLDMPVAIAKALTQSGVVLHPSRRMKKYLQAR